MATKIMFDTIVVETLIGEQLEILLKLVVEKKEGDDILYHNDSLIILREDSREELKKRGEMSTPLM